MPREEQPVIKSFIHLCTFLKFHLTDHPNMQNMEASALDNIITQTSLKEVIVEKEIKGFNTITLR